MNRLFPSLCALLGIAGILPVGCYPYVPELKLCEDAVPEGGCPTGRGGTCEDPSCKALYDCVDAAWKKTATCPPTGGAGGAGGVPTGGTGGASTGGTGGETSTGGAGGCSPTGLDHTGETTGCVPDLQSPDCPAAAADPCAETACQTGCLDFYICKQDPSGKSWVAVGYCDDTGHLIASPP
jgi:hypothetical protein